MPTKNKVKVKYFFLFTNEMMFKFIVLAISTLPKIYFHYERLAISANTKLVRLKRNQNTY